MEWPGPRDDLDPDLIGRGEETGLLSAMRARMPRSGGPRFPSGKRWRWIAAVLAAGVVAAVAVTVLPATHPGTGPDAGQADHPASADQAVALNISSVMTGKVMPDGAFASGRADGRGWRLAVQNIAYPGGGCQPAVTLNGNDAGPLFPDPARITPVGNPAFLTLGSSMPGVGFGFVQVRAGATRAWTAAGPGGAQTIALPPATVDACGETFRLIGFAYPLTATVRIHETSGSVNSVYNVPSVLSDPRPTLGDPLVSGVWQDLDTARASVASALLAAGTAYGQRWSVRLQFGTAGDCFSLTTTYLDDSASATPSVSGFCGPVRTPGGLATIVAMALGSLGSGDLGTGYAVSVGPDTAHLLAQLTSGRTFTVPVVTVDGRKYAAFFVPEPSRLMWLNALDSTGHEVAGLENVPFNGYTQFPL